MSVQPNNNTINMSIEEIRHNLNTMANTLCDANAVVDTGFIEIFHSAINNIQGKKSTDIIKAKSELSETLKSISSKLDQQAKKSELFSKKSLVGEPCNLADLAMSRVDCTVKSGMNRLSKIFDMQSVAGDNHCLFRSVMMGYIKNKWCNLSDDARIEELERLESLSEKLSEQLKMVMPKGYPSLRSIFADVQIILIRIGNNQATLNDLINDPATSNCLVLFSRMITSAYYLNQPNVVLESDAKAFGKNIKQYLIDMATMKKEQWGGDAEIIALAKILGLQIQVNDLDQIGKGQPIDPKHHLFKSSSKDHRVDLLRFPGHYNLGVRKQQS